MEEEEEARGFGGVLCSIHINTVKMFGIYVCVYFKRFLLFVKRILIFFVVATFRCLCATYKKCAQLGDAQTLTRSHIHVQLLLNATGITNLKRIDEACNGV